MLAQLPDEVVTADVVGVVAVVAEVALDLVAAVDAAVEAVVALVLVELVELVVLVAAAMQPVSATIPTTLDTPATRRAFRAGCGRRRRTGVRCATALCRGADFGVSGPGGRGWAVMVAPSMDVLYGPSKVIVQPVPPSGLGIT
ncbi:MAG: hypothetical protein JWM72_3498 [Actinomycetia bacterium]|nr:hypothetical protein [Actinomycetes bacterium]